MKDQRSAHQSPQPLATLCLFEAERFRSASDEQRAFPFSGQKRTRQASGNQPSSTAAHGDRARASDSVRRRRFST